MTPGSSWYGWLRPGTLLLTMNGAPGSIFPVVVSITSVEDDFLHCLFDSCASASHFSYSARNATLASLNEDACP
jgi:hypothetical protein